MGGPLLRLLPSSSHRGVISVGRYSHIPKGVHGLSPWDTRSHNRAIGLAVSSGCLFMSILKDTPFRLQAKNFFCKTFLSFDYIFW